MPVAPAADDAVLAGYAVSLIALGGVAIATALISPYGLLFVVPSLYAWLWLPQVERRSAWARDVLYGIGLAGPALAVVVIGTQLGLGLDTPLYLVSLMTLGFIPWATVLVLLAWAAIACQLGALAGGPLPAGAATLAGGTPATGTALAARAAGSRSARRQPERPVPRGMWTIASAAVVCTIMCDSCPASGSRTGPASVHEIRARAKSSRSGRGLTSRASVPGRNRGAGSGSPWSARSAGVTKSSAPDERRERVPGQAEDERRSADAEGERLARTHRDAPEDLLDAELRLDAADEVVRPDRDATRGDDHIGLRAPCTRACSSAASVSSAGASRSTIAPASSKIRASMIPFDS